MKRVIALCAAMGLLLLSGVSASAQTTFTYVTDFDYAVIRDGGVDGTYVYAAYEGDAYVMGTMTAMGEQSRTPWSADGWKALFAPSDWSMTLHGDAASLCPYAHTHTDVTLCPYLDVALVTLTNKQTGVQLSNRYIAHPVKHITSGNSLHLCWGRYGFTSPETLKWDGENTLVAVCNEQGLWGVFDTVSGTMLTAYAYEQMSAVYGSYAKVYNGTAWGRLDVSGTQETVYLYESEEDFSVREELREIGEGQWQVFDAENEPLSVVFEVSGETLSYEPESSLVLVTASDGSKTLTDLSGNAVANFTARQKVTHLSDACYAVELFDEAGAVLGVALARIEVTPLAGDVHADGILDSRDVRLVLRYIVDIQEFSEMQCAAAELNADGEINSKDVRLLMFNIVETN